MKKKIPKRNLAILAVITLATIGAVLGSFVIPLGEILSMVQHKDYYGADYLINENVVYINDSNVYLSAEPHTLNSKGWVYFNLTSKVYTGDIDLVFGVNTTQLHPKKIELYNPHNITWNTTESELFYNVSSIQLTSAPCEIGNEYNSIKRNVTHIIEGFPVSNIVCFDTYSNLGGGTYQVWFNQHHIELIEWVDKTDTLTSIDYNFGGNNKWWYVQNVPVIAGNNYQARAYVEIPFNYNTYGKYWVAVKPSSETIQQAIGNGHLYYLDPWWSANFTKCMDLNVTNPTGSALANFPIYLNISYDSDMQADYDDLRFVNASCNQTGTELDYEIENYTATNAHVWVRVPNLASGVNTLSVYYGNSSIGSGANPTGVWDSDYKAVWHMKDATTSTINDSTSNVVHGTKNDGANRPLEVPGKIANAQKFNQSDTNGIAFGNPASTQYGDFITLEAWVNVNKLGVNNVILGRLYWDPYLWRIRSTNTNQFLNYDFQGKESNSSLPSANAWHHVAVVWTNSSKTGAFYINGQPKGVQTYTNYMLPPFNDLQIGWYSSDYFNGSMDEVRMSNTNRTAEWINMEYENIVNQSGLVTFGPEQNATEPTPPPASVYLEWNVSTLDLGSGYTILEGAADLTSTGQNNNTVVTCQAGNCTVITQDFPNGTNMTDTQSISVNFTCSNSTIGYKWAVFNATSDQNTTGTVINVTCNTTTTPVPPASVYLEWNVSTLDLGSGYTILEGAADLTSTGQNNNTVVTCQSGNCTVITQDFPNGTNMTDTQSISVNFTCDNTTTGTFWALYNATSDQNTTGTVINVTCEITTAPVLNCTYSMRYALGQIRFNDNQEMCNQTWNVSYSYTIQGEASGTLQTLLNIFPLLLVIGIISILGFGIAGRLNILTVMLMVFMLAITLYLVVGPVNDMMSETNSTVENVTNPIITIWYNLSNLDIVTGSETVTNGTLVLGRS